VENQPAVQNNPTSSSGFMSKLENGGKGFFLTSVLISLIIPPAGMLIAILLITTLKHRRRNLLLLLAVLLAAVCGWLVYLKTFSIYVNHKNKYHYQQTVEQNVSSASVGDLSFQKPVEFKENHRFSGPKNTTVTYTHINEKKYSIGFMGVSATSSDLASDKKYVEGVKYLMEHPGGNDYDKYAGNYFKDFIKSFSGPDSTVELSQPKPFTNSNIKNNAWIFDVKSTNPDSKKIAPLQGQFIYAAGKKSFYYFSMMAIEDNWQSNSGLWYQVKNSIKIDQ
jgi:hypothetical protein